MGFMKMLLVGGVLALRQNEMVGFTDTQRLMWLDALEVAGVDNWDGYDEALRIYKEWVKEETDKYENP